MEYRRPTRPPTQSRRNLFAPSSRRRLPPSMSNSSHSTNISTAETLVIPAEEPEPKNDLVERDADGNYIIANPGKAGYQVPEHMLRNELDEEIEQEDQLISLYLQQNTHQWDDHGAIMNEIRQALASSLERKVQSLENDKWMFEGDAKSKT